MIKAGASGEENGILRHIATGSRKHLQKLQGFLAFGNPIIFEKHHSDLQKCLKVKESTPLTFEDTPLQHLQVPLWARWWPEPDRLTQDPISRLSRDSGIQIFKWVKKWDILGYEIQNDST